MSAGGFLAFLSPFVGSFVGRPRRSESWMECLLVWGWRPSPLCSGCAVRRHCCCCRHHWALGPCGPCGRPSRCAACCAAMPAHCAVPASARVQRTAPTDESHRRRSVSAMHHTADSRNAHCLHCDAPVGPAQRDDHRHLVLSMGRGCAPSSLALSHCYHIAAAQTDTQRHPTVRVGSSTVTARRTPQP